MLDVLDMARARRGARDGVAPLPDPDFGPPGGAF